MKKFVLREELSSAAEFNELVHYLKTYKQHAIKHPRRAQAKEELAFLKTVVPATEYFTSYFERFVEQHINKTDSESVGNVEWMFEFTVWLLDRVSFLQDASSPDIS